MNRILDVTRDKINSYLWHGYVPKKVAPNELWETLPKPDLYTKYTPEVAALKLDVLFDQLTVMFDGPYLVPLSSGWDSRLILCALVEKVGASMVHTVTFGCPGQLDFDIGIQIAHALGVKHTAINLAIEQVAWKQLLDTVRIAPWTLTPDCYYNYLAREHAAQVNACSVFVGFLGDPLTGGHYSKLPLDTSPDQLQAAFALSQRRAKGQSLTEADYFPFYPRIPDEMAAPFHLTEWFDIGIRQASCVAPIVLGKSEWCEWSPAQGQTSTGATIVAPFCDPYWASYWLHAPRYFHRGQRLYYEMARYKYPDVFSLPSKHLKRDSALGHLPYTIHQVMNKAVVRISQKAPWFPIRSNLHLNYLDYDEAFRQRRDYQELLEEAFRYLNDRQIVPWIRLDSLKQAHNRREANYGEAFKLFVGLAANLAYEEYQF